MMPCLGGDREDAMEDARLLDLGGYPEIRADGLAQVFSYAGNAHIILFGWRRIDGIWRQTVAGLVIRPLTALLPEQIPGAEKGRMFLN